MSFRTNEDWDLCWHYLSRTGCRNSNCTWRHENSGGRFYQNYTTKTRGKGVNYRGDARKKPGAPFYPIKQHQDGGVEDQFGLIHYPDMDKKDARKKSITFRDRLGYRQESEHTRPFSSPMSVSSSGMTSAPTSSANSIITSQGGSDSEGDMVKDAMLVSTGDLGKLQKGSSRAFLDELFGELKTPTREMKMKWQRDEAVTSSFSPFAKVFVPRDKSLTSKDAIIAGLNKMTLKNLAVFSSQEPANVKSCETQNDKVYE